MRLLGLDVGEKTIGVAVSDELGWTAQAVTVIRRQELSEDLAQLRAIIDRYQVSELVVGLPKNMNGSIGPQAEKAMAFAATLREEMGLKATLWDERLTTVAANRSLLQADLSRARRRQVIDKVAAVLILQGYLDGRSKSSPID